MKKDGLILIDKPEGMSSHGVVRIVKKSLNISKVGHLGTLDPFATGLLPILVGGATRLADHLMTDLKQYLFTLRLGSETDTLDPMGQLVCEHPVPFDWEHKLRLALPQYVGAIQQVPPVYSALKMNGRPLYEHMRVSGHLPLDIQTKTRTVVIHSLDVVAVDPQTSSCVLRCVCEKGTYIRSLCRDLAVALGSVGLCQTLRRERVGEWSVDDAVSFQGGMLDAERLKSCFVPVEHLMPAMPRLCFPPECGMFLENGNMMRVLRTDVERWFGSVCLGEALFLDLSKNLVFLGEVQESEDVDMLKFCPKKKLST